MAAVIGMIPEGLVFLTSVALAISAYKLGKQKVLVQELYCIETLARTDTLCLDKTGSAVIIPGVKSCVFTVRIVLLYKISFILYIFFL